MSGGRCKGGGVETPELPGPLLREGKMEPGSVPNARCPGPGSSTDKCECSSIPSPSLRTPTCPKASGPRLLQPRGARASLGPQLRGVCHQPQGEDTGPGPQGGCGAVGRPVRLQPSLPGASRVSSRRGCPTTMGGGLWVCRRCLGPVTAGTRIWDGGAAEEREIGATGCASGALGPQV